ncbi:MAG: aldo/keto reductase [Desulfitobacterium hafniense]|nr:aldo/keto reductase [Desulfitobacterium hafniense]
MKLGLGTVQFGLDYGISNQQGKTSANEAEKILAVAACNGMRVLDTAALYGGSEDMLGQLLPPEHDFNVVTKTPKFSAASITERDAKQLEDTFYQSLTKMRQNSIYGLLVHHADDLLSLNGNLLFEKMKQLKEKGLVQKVGVSVYNAEQIDGILAKYQIDLIQLPVNVLDQRLLRTGCLGQLKRQGIEIHVRSAFLQGLLLTEPHALSSYFEKIKAHLQGYRQFITKQNLTPVQAALGFVLAQDEVDSVVCGVNNCQQLSEICQQIKQPMSFEGFEQFALDDENILNPAKWRL